mgnify:CR=1 FL=1
MTTAYWCLIIVMMITYGLTAIAKFSNKGYDNSKPRKYLDELDGPAKRAYWAHLNSLESLPQFGIALLIAHQLEMPQSNIDMAAIIFTISRLFYGYFYIKDRAWSRSWCWVIGMACIVYLIIGKGIHG